MLVKIRLCANAAHLRIRTFVRLTCLFQLLPSQTRLQPCLQSTTAVPQLQLASRRSDLPHGYHIHASPLLQRSTTIECLLPLGFPSSPLSINPAAGTAMSVAFLTHLERASPANSQVPRFTCTAAASPPVVRRKRVVHLRTIECLPKFDPRAYGGRTSALQGGDRTCSVVDPSRQ